MPIKPEDIKKLREKTGVGIMECQAALKESKGDLEKAIGVLRKRGEKLMAQKQKRIAPEGLIEAYIHPGGKIGALVEVNCETDFVARTKDFKELVHNLAMQVAATNSLYLRPEDIPRKELEKEKKIYQEQLKDSSKTSKIAKKIIEGKLEKYYQEVCLLKQPFIKEEKISIEQLIAKNINKLGEKIEIKRFIRFSL